MEFQNPGSYPGATSVQGSTIYYGVSPAKVDGEELRAAEKRLARLPVAEVPPPAPLPEHSWMWVPRNPFFVGRHDDLRRLAAMLAAGDAAAVTGLGGLGKTQLAAEFVHRYGQFLTGGAVWLNFAKAADAAGEVARCGGPRGLALRDDFNDLPQPAQVELVLSAWSSAPPAPSDLRGGKFDGRSTISA